MSKLKHTPGPWFVFDNAMCVGGPFTPGKGDDPKQTTAGVAMCGMRLRFNEEAEANARLIAAAPEMLFALHLFGLWEHLPTDRGGKDGQKGRAWTAFVEAKDAAIVKAAGGAR